MNNGPRFLVRTEKIEERKLPVVSDEQSFSVNAPTPMLKRVETDLDLLEVNRLTQQLVDNFQKNNDVGIIRSFFRTKRYEKQLEMLSAMERLVISIRSISQTAEEFKIHLIAKQYIFPLIIKGKVEEAEHAIEKSRQEHITYIHGQNVQRQRADLDLLRARKEIEIMEAQIARANAETGLISRQGEIMDSIRGQISFREMPPLMQAIILIKAINPMANMDVDAVLKDKVLSGQLEKMAAEVANMNAKTAQEKVRAQYEEWKAKEEMKGPAYV